MGLYRNSDGSLRNVVLGPPSDPVPEIDHACKPLRAPVAVRKTFGQLYSGVEPFLETVVYAVLYRQDDALEVAPHGLREVLEVLRPLGQDLSVPLAEEVRGCALVAVRTPALGPPLPRAPRPARARFATYRAHAQKTG